MKSQLLGTGRSQQLQFSSVLAACALSSKEQGEMTQHRQRQLKRGSVQGTCVCPEEHPWYKARSRHTKRFPGAKEGCEAQPSSPCLLLVLFPVQFQFSAALRCFPDFQTQNPTPSGEGKEASIPVAQLFCSQVCPRLLNAHHLLQRAEMEVVRGARYGMLLHSPNTPGMGRDLGPAWVAHAILAKIRDFTQI